MKPEDLREAFLLAEGVSYSMPANLTRNICQNSKFYDF